MPGTDTPTEILIDHAASLQRDVDRLARELLALALAIAMLGAALALHLWRMANE